METKPALDGAGGLWDESMAFDWAGIEVAASYKAWIRRLKEKLGGTRRHRGGFAPLSTNLLPIPKKKRQEGNSDEEGESWMKNRGIREMNNRTDGDDLIVKWEF